MSRFFTFLHGLLTEWHGLLTVFHVFSRLVFFAYFTYANAGGVFHTSITAIHGDKLCKVLRTVRLTIKDACFTV